MFFLLLISTLPHFHNGILLQNLSPYHFPFFRLHSYYFYITMIEKQHRNLHAPESVIISESKRFIGSSGSVSMSDSSLNFSLSSSRRSKSYHNVIVVVPSSSIVRLSCNQGPSSPICILVFRTNWCHSEPKPNEFKPYNALRLREAYDILEFVQN